MQWKLLVDFGTVVLIWMTQLVVYPSFSFFSNENLLSWHAKYTGAVSIVVMPLMLTQALLHGWGLVDDFSYLRLIAALLVLLVWVNTFFYAVPLHNQIAEDQNIQEAAKQLVSVNWWRTGLWSLVFLLGLFESLRT